MKLSFSTCPMMLAFYLAVITGLCCSVNAATDAATSKCRRESEGKEESPTFLCLVEVTVVRETDCTAFITERYVFPHTTGKDSD